MALAMTASSARTWRSPSSSNLLCRKDWSELSVRFCSPGLRRWSGAAVVVCAAGKRNPGPKPRSGTQARRKPKVQRIVDSDDEDVEKALEALFAQLEMDLIEEGDDGGDDEEFTDEELAQMTKELEAAYIDMDREDDDEDEDTDSSGLVDMVMTDGVYSQGKAQAREQEDEDEDDDEDFEDDDDEQRMVPLDKWQLLKLAAAVKKGRRNVNVKSLAAELGMDRADVLTFLKNPPPDLLLMSAQLAAEDDEEEDEEESDAEEIVIPKVSRRAAPRKQSVAPPTTPSGAPQSPRNWHGSKRLKKEHLATFERVYRQTNRPSNTMIENLVNLTHVPRKKVLQWFDERRAEDNPKKESFKNAPES